MRCASGRTTINLSCGSIRSSPIACLLTDLEGNDARELATCAKRGSISDGQIRVKMTPSDSRARRTVEEFQFSEVGHISKLAPTTTSTFTTGRPLYDY